MHTIEEDIERISKMYNVEKDEFVKMIGGTDMIKYDVRMRKALEFLKENPEVIDNSFENRGRFIAKYINLIGGSKQLSYMGRDYLKTELNKIKPIILQISSRSDVQNKNISEILRQ